MNIGDEVVYYGTHPKLTNGGIYTIYVILDQSTALITNSIDEVFAPMSNLKLHKSKPKYSLETLTDLMKTKIRSIQYQASTDNYTIELHLDIQDRSTFYNRKHYNSIKDIIDEFN